MNKTQLLSPLCWPGGKSLMVKEILFRIPPHRVYVEPFVGAGHVFWAKEPSEVEVINDLDSALIKWYKDLKKRSRFACDMTPDRDKWSRIKKKTSPLGFCDYLQLVKFSYGCRQVSFHSSIARRCSEKEDPSKCSVTKFSLNFDEYKRRLSNTKILNQDYRKVLTRFDSREMFAYLDPPYHDVECLYASCDVHPGQIAEALEDLEGKWLLSYNDHRDVRAAFKGYKIKKIEHQYSITTNSAKNVTELLISNY